jgi:hypothetical protein
VSGPRGADALARLDQIRQRLADALLRVDPHHRLTGRPVTYRLIDGGTLEITYRDVPAIADAELLAVRRVIGAESSCTVTPQTAETLTVRFVVAVDAARGDEA